MPPHVAALENVDIEIGAAENDYADRPVAPWIGDFSIAASALPLRQPAADPNAVIFIFHAECSTEMRLFPEDNEKMTTERHAERVSQNGHGLKERCPTKDHRKHAHIHRVTHEAIGPLRNELLRRIDRGGRSATNYGEIPRTPRV